MTLFDASNCATRQHGMPVVEQNRDHLNHESCLPTYCGWARL